MNTIGNIIWLVFGGFVAAVGYVVGGFVLCLTIVGIPFGWQCFKLAAFVPWPFGRQAIDTSFSGGCISLLLNIIWILYGGIWIALSHIVFGLLLFMTIIGIPFARQHFKLVPVSLMPFGKKIVEID